MQSYILHTPPKGEFFTLHKLYAFPFVEELEPFKRSLVFVVDGYDMLQQLRNVTYMVNAQARTETVSNVIPSYVLFHIQYRFNRQPKKH